MDHAQQYSDGPDHEFDTVVVGGGQAGLTIGFHLARRLHRDILILDAHDRVGDAWRQRWDSLRLFTPAKYDGLPGMPFPGDRLAFPTKDEMADYLEAYAARFELPVLTGIRVDRVGRIDGRFVVEAGERSWTARNVVIAAGGHQVPRVPAFAGQLDASVRQLHSEDYRNPHELRAGPVLVVGLGNSGAEIALEVSRTHPTTVAGTPGGELPFRHGRALARFGLPLIRFAGVHVLNFGTPIGRRVLPTAAKSATPLIRTRLAELEEAGVSRAGRVTGVEGGMPVVDGRALDVADVIWCTGYRDDLRFIDLPVFDDDGRLRQTRGVVGGTPGLYAVGLDLMYAIVSATLPGMPRDAAYLARRMRRVEAPDAAGVGRTTSGVGARG
ncbi:flavin-containing monooxygenase [Agromyces sp. NPDC058136]|uniref:flavin-containing monooxygenase n=1 Tax=Agromyces sp. NPDC058136 TaxID=3346354 RepID=UPI0036DA6596